MIPRPFATWTSYKDHTGVDYPYRTGTPIYVDRPGRVIFAKWFNDRNGYMKAVDHGTGHVQRYYHLESLQGPKVGEDIPAGALVGYVGNTGSASKGPHLHHELWYLGRNQPPMAYWNFIDPYHYIGDGSTAGGQNVMNATQEAKLDAVLIALGAGGLTPSGSVVWPDTIMGNVRSIQSTLNNVNAWVSEGGPGVDSGAAKPGTVAARTINLDRQVTGADGFDQPGQSSVAARVIEIQGDTDSLLSRPAATITDAQIQAIADAVASQIPGAVIDYERVAADVRERFRTDPLK